VRTNVYVDGFNLFYGALRGTPHRWLDLEAFFDGLLPRNQVQTIHYFTARVKPRPDDPDAHLRQQVYLRALGTLPRVQIHFGSFLVNPVRMPLAAPTAGSPRTVEVIKSEEKGSDVNLAVQLVADAFRQAAQAFVVVSNDSDLTEPLRLVRHDLGYPVGLVNPHRHPSQALMRCRPSFTLRVSATALGAAQFPDLIPGTPLQKPNSW